MVVIIIAEYSKSDNCSFCLHGGGQWMAKTTELTKNEGITTEYIQEVMKDILKILGEPSREYKDRVFRMLLNDPAVALEVYNAMNGKRLIFSHS